MPKQIKNLASLIRNYNSQLIDLINYSCVEPSRESITMLLKNILYTLYGEIKRRRVDNPVHTQVYASALKHILNNKGIIVKKGPSIKELKIKQYIELSPPPRISASEIKNALKEIDVAERVILCLFYRHRLALEEISFLVSKSVGTVISKISKAKEKIGQYVLRQIRVEQSLDVSDNYNPTSECFFIKNLQSRFEGGLISERDKEKIETHISSCRLCRNYYNWQEEIERALCEGPVLQYDIVSEIDIIKAIDRRERRKRLMNIFKTNWKLRTSAFGIVLIITVFSVLVLKDNISILKEELFVAQDFGQKAVDEIPTPVNIAVKTAVKTAEQPAAVQAKAVQVEESHAENEDDISNHVFFVCGPNMSMRADAAMFLKDSVKVAAAVTAKEDQKAPEPQVQQALLAQIPVEKEIQEQDEKVLASEATAADSGIPEGQEPPMVYKLITNTDNWQELDLKIKNLLKLNNAEKAGQLEFGDEANGGSYYHFTVPNNDFEQLIARLKELEAFQIIKEKETRHVSGSRTRCVVWIGRTKQ